MIYKLMKGDLIMEALSTAITTFMGLVESLLSAILANSVLVVIFAGGMVGFIARGLRKVIKASKIG